MTVSAKEAIDGLYDIVSRALDRSVGPALIASLRREFTHVRSALQKDNRFSDVRAIEAAINELAKSRGDASSELFHLSYVVYGAKMSLSEQKQE